MQIPLTGGLVAIVDDEDAHLFDKYKWTARTDSGGRTYVLGCVNGRTVGLHRVVMGMPTGKVIDHINRNPLDNRKANLRLCTTAENIRNGGRKGSFHQSRYKGVWREGRWRAKITVDAKNIHLGRFDTELQAALAYDEAARRYHGEFACTNAGMGLYRQAA